MSRRRQAPAGPLLTPKQLRFAEEYAVDLNATQAAIRAGYSLKSCASQGERLLRNAEMQRTITAAAAARSRRTEITADAVLRRFWAIATADPRDLIEYRRTCCRYCHSINHEYHRTKCELDRDRAAWESLQKKSSKEDFNVAGGIGFNATREPAPECPECFGEGVERAFIHDTRRLSAPALCLYAGVKVTKDGIEVKMHDQHAALTNVARHLGMFEEKRETPLSEEERITRLRAGLAAMDAMTRGAAA